MSVESLAIALHHSRARGAVKLVLIGIANHDGDGGAWPAVATLARYAGVTPRQAQKCVRELEQLGEIVTYRSAGGNHFTADHMRPNLYQFKLSCPPDCDRTSRHKRRGEVVPTELPGFVEEMHERMSTPKLSTGVSPTTGGAPEVIHRGVAHDRGGVSPTTPEPSFNLTTKTDLESPVIAGARLYNNLLAEKCSAAPRGKHKAELSGYCRYCGERVA